MNNYEYEIVDYYLDNDDIYIDYIVKDNIKNKKINACSFVDVADIDKYDIGNDITDELLEIVKKNNGCEFNLPKTSELHKITYDIYKDLCDSDNNMIWIDNLEDFMLYNITNKNYQLLLDDIKKFNLQNYFDISDNSITVYGGLQCCFNDDRDSKDNKLER